MQGFDGWCQLMIKKAQNTIWVKLSILLTVVVCSIFCSPIAEAFHVEAGSQCGEQELGECSDHQSSALCEESCDYEFRKDQMNDLLPDLVARNSLTLFVSAPKTALCPCVDSGHSSRHSFAIRHLDTIILRV